MQFLIAIFGISFVSRSNGRELLNANMQPRDIIERADDPLPQEVWYQDHQESWQGSSRPISASQHDYV